MKYKTWNSLSTGFLILGVICTLTPFISYFVGSSLFFILGVYSFLISLYIKIKILEKNIPPSQLQDT